MKAKITVNAAKPVRREDIFTAGNLVVSEKGEIVFIISYEAYSGNTFSGVEITNNHFCNSWIKDYFVQFHGNVVINTEV